LIGHGCKSYWTTKWNYIDVAVLVTSAIDIGVTLGIGFDKISDPAVDTSRGNYLKPVKAIISVFRLARLSRSLRLFRVKITSLNFQ
jgi:hypothetical protein